MPPLLRLILIFCVLTVASLAGWLGGLRFGVDPARLPKPRLEVGAAYQVARHNAPALGSHSASLLRDALFARQNGIPIQHRLESGEVFPLMPGSKVRLLEEDLDLALVQESSSSTPSRKFWMAVEDLAELPTSGH